MGTSDESRIRRASEVAARIVFDDCRCDSADHFVLPVSERVTEDRLAIVARLRDIAADESAPDAKFAMLDAASDLEEEIRAAGKEQDEHE